MFADYEFYVSRYFGKMKEDDFISCERFAEDYINGKTDYIFEENGYPDENSSLSRRLKLCICAVAEECYHNNSMGGKASETVGNYSVSYANTTSDDEEKAYMKLLEMYIPDVLKTVKWI